MRDQPRMGWWAVKVVAAPLLLVTGIAAFAATLSASPAVNEDLRMNGPFGDWRHVPADAFYDAGEYHFEMGYRYAMALVGDFLAQARGEKGFFEDRAAVLAKARDLLQQALFRSPADARAWTALALVAGIQDDRHLQMRALRRSWDLAPYSAALSRLRLLTLAVMAPESPGPEVKEAIARDTRVMQRNKRDSVERLQQVSPELDQLLDSLEKP